MSCEEEAFPKLTKASIARVENPIVVDTRKTEDRASATEANVVPGSLNIPYDKESDAFDVDQLENLGVAKDAAVLVHWPQLQSNVPQAGSSAGTENRPSAPSQGRNAPSSDARGAATEGKPSAPSQPARSSPSGEKVPPKLTDTKGIANAFSRLAGRL